MTEHRVISSDSHVYEPPDLWTARMEPDFRDRAPHIEHCDDGDFWYCEGRRGQGIPQGAQAGFRFDRQQDLTYQDRFDSVRPGGYDPEERIKDMELDGIYGELVYPTAGLLFYAGVSDGRLLSSIFRTYNDWLAEFCNSYPERLRGVAMVNVDDVGDAVAELERARKNGLVGAMITVYPPETAPYDRPEYEPLWATAQDLDMPISLHMATGRAGHQESQEQLAVASPAFLINTDYWVRMSVTYMIFSGVFERYPQLQVGAVEHELGWIPYYLAQCDYTYTQRPRGEGWHQFKGDPLPSDFFHRNVFLSFQEDAMGIRDREVIGVDNILWGSDYPHVESTFPRSQEILREILSPCTEEEKAKIVGGNAARIYGLG